MIAIAQTDQEIRECFSVMEHLRPHLVLETFLEQVERMRLQHQYQLIYLRDEYVVCVAGIRIGEWLHTGRYLEIEDLITLPQARSQSYGEQIFHWILDYAKQERCQQVRLVSGVAREAAHRFYLKQGMRFEAKYFSMDVRD